MNKATYSCPAISRRLKTIQLKPSQHLQFPHQTSQALPSLPCIHYTPPTPIALEAIMPTHQLPFTTEDLEEASSIGFEIEGIEYFAVKKFGEISVYRNRCPHRGLPLHWQPNVFLDYDKELIQCAVHGALFTVHEGKCIAGPCVGQVLEKIPYNCDSINIHLSI